MGLATWLSLRREKRGGNWRRPARVALVGALAYIGLNWGISQLAERDALTRALMDFARDVQHSADSIEVAPDSRVAVIANPLPIKFWEREKLYGRDGEWVKVIQISYDDSFAESISPSRCAWPKLGRLQRQRPDVDAFLFWSRAPFAERAPDGSVILRDARFYDPRARAGFSIALPEVPCVELADE
jgi:inner membrane protein